MRETLKAIKEMTGDTRQCKLDKLDGVSRWRAASTTSTGMGRLSVSHDDLSASPASSPEAPAYGLGLFKPVYDEVGHGGDATTGTGFNVSNGRHSV